MNHGPLQRPSTKGKDHVQRLFGNYQDDYENPENDDTAEAVQAAILPTAQPKPMLTGTEMRTH